MIETFFPACQDLELWARYGLDVNAINNVGCKVEWENTQNMGQAKKYAALKVPSGGYMFPAYDLNHSFADCDVYVSMSKLKNHWIAGVTMALKNNFGNTPCSLYGGDCGESGNENPAAGARAGVPQRHTAAAQGRAAGTPAGYAARAGYRVPRIVADLVGARPIDLSIVDGIETIRGGEGEWNPGVSLHQAGPAAGRARIPSAWTRSRWP